MAAGGSPVAGRRSPGRGLDPLLRRPQRPPGVGRLGLTLFLASLTMLFGAGLAGYLVTLLAAREWPPPGAPPLPRGLWLSSALALAVSGAVQRALQRIRAGDAGGLARWLRLALLCAFAFLASQAWNWTALAGRGGPAGVRNLYGFSFYFLTVLHALHVLGGLIPLGVTTARAAARRYAPGAHEGVSLCAAYWHFLAAVWLVIFAALHVGGMIR
ncbi:MAG: heme-copper oxidase subunit III [Acidobacteria bacterium]|nr:MAG: heme-copper oxidase subunit III [Acidobacteriota bacterium]